jgi:hypothetical protein
MSYSTLDRLAQIKRSIFADFTGILPVVTIYSINSLKIQLRSPFWTSISAISVSIWGFPGGFNNQMSFSN